jgi:group I intron endonuclease
VIVYCITNRVNGKRYIGQTVASLQQRWRQHVCLKSGCTALKRAIKKYGKNNFEKSVLEKCENQKALDFLEQYWINIFQTFGVGGYNLTSGGDHPVISEEISRKRNFSLSGERHYNWGKHLSVAHKEKISEKLIGKKRPTEVREKISRTLLGHSVSLVVREKISCNHRGKKLSEQTKKKISASHAGEKSYLAKLNWLKVREIRRVYTGTPGNLGELSKFYGVCKDSIRRILKNKVWREAQCLNS